MTAPPSIAEELRGAGLRVTAARVALLETVRSGDHLDAEAIAAGVRDRVGHVSLQAVYEALHALTHAGLIRRIEPAGSPTRYEGRVMDNHHHLVLGKPSPLETSDSTAISTTKCGSAMRIRESSQSSRWERTSASTYFPPTSTVPLESAITPSSLRIGGQACAQVQQLRRLVLSTVEASSFRSTYRLGKNHMRDLTDVGHFEVAPFRSATFGLPLPKDVLGYRELERIDGFDTGIHRIHLYRTVHRVVHPEEAAALAHVHRYYAQWRADRGLSTPWLVR